jgi:hypothetical protein
MLVKKLTLIAAAASLLLSGVARAQDNGALLDLLVRKGVINDQEAEEVRAELTKSAPRLRRENGNYRRPSRRLELYGDARVRYEYRGGRTANDTPVAARSGVAGGTIGRSAAANVIAFVLGCAEHWRTIGFSAFDWKQAPVIARRMSRLGVTVATARFRKTTTVSTSARLISAIADSETSL